jgi:hypothetical protein
MSHKPKIFRLSFVGAGETLPRLVTAYGRACEGEFALVMRPTEQTAVLVLVTKKQKDQPPKAFLWGANTSDWPRRPTTEVLPTEAVKAVSEMKAKPPRAGDITLKGQWTGTLACDAGEPVVTLRRKVASYGWLTITSTNKGWVPAFERQEKWFSTPDADTSAAKATLAEAITAGMQVAMKLVCGACSTRDTTRRQALDTQYAEQRPIRAPKDGRDATERLKPPKVTLPRAPRKVAAPRASSTAKDWRAAMQAAVVKPFELEGIEAFEDFQGILDTLKAALHAVRGAPGRWAALRKAGADDKTLREALKTELGTGGGTTTTSYGSWSSRISGRSVEVTIGHYIFKGTSLLALTRLALNLPPVQATSKPAVISPPATAKKDLGLVVGRDLTVVKRHPEHRTFNVGDVWRVLDMTSRGAVELGQLGKRGTPLKSTQMMVEPSLIRELMGGYLAPAGSPQVTVARKVAEPPTASTPDALGHQAASVEAEAEALQAVEEASPHNVQRAENLLAYTRRLVANPHCQGVDKREAEAALHRAQQAVDKAREDGVARHLQRAGAELALSAAKVARSCGRGQLSLTARAAEAAAAPPKKAARTKPSTPRKASAPRKPRTPKAPAPAPAPTSGVSQEEKDKALMGMFQAAITAALKEAA